MLICRSSVALSFFAARDERRPMYARAATATRPSRTRKMVRMTDVRWNSSVLSARAKSNVVTSPASVGAAVGGAEALPVPVLVEEAILPCLLVFSCCVLLVVVRFVGGMGCELAFAFALFALVSLSVFGT